jgi:hypothetical protein
MTESLPPTPTLTVRFGGGDDVDVAPVIQESREEFDRVQARVALAEEVHGRQAELEAWLAADPDHPQLLLSDPRSALQQAFPDLEVPEVAAAGQELMARLLRFRESPAAGVVIYTPPEVFAVKLLHDVAEDAASRPTGYDELFADIRGTVTRIEAGRFGTDVINRVVDGISRARGLPVPAPMRTSAQPVWSALAAFLDEHPDVRENLE